MRLKKPTALNKAVLLHMSPTVNRKSIELVGLTINNEPSGYGKEPEQNAVYLFHEDNINMIYDMLKTFPEFDIWEVRNLKGTRAVADEDAKGAKNWKESLAKFGTLAYLDAIPPKNLKRIATMTRAE